MGLFLDTALEQSDLCLGIAFPDSDSGVTHVQDYTGPRVAQAVGQALQRARARQHDAQLVCWEQTNPGVSITLDCLPVDGRPPVLRIV